MKQTTNTLLALAAATGFASAATTTLITADPTTYTDASTSEGNWHYQSLTLNDAGFTVTGGPVLANMNLESITFVHDASSSNDGLFLVVMTDVTDLNSIVAQSTNTIDMSAQSGGDLMKWDFANDTLVSSTEYFFAFYQDTVADGNIAAGDTASTARFAMQGDLIAGGTRSQPTGGIAGSLDAMVNIQINNVPEPSSTALLGLGGLALILRRRK